MNKRFLLIAGFPESILQFRGALLDALQAQGLDVHVAAPDLGPDSAIRQTLQARGLTVHDIPLQRTGMNPIKDLGSLVSLRRLMRRLRPHYTLAYTIKPVIYGTLAGWLAGVPRRYALITGLGYAFQGDEQTQSRSALRNIAQWLYRQALGKAHKTFFQNPDDEALFRSLKILSAQQPSCIVNGSGVDLDRYQVAPLPRAPHFLLIARLLGDKGVREYAAAAEHMRARHPECIFSLAGWIDDNPDAIAQTELQGWIDAGHINYLGRLQDVRPAIADCNVYVLPSYREGTPRTVLEAMAMGRAIITTDAPGCRQTVQAGHNGLLVQPRSVYELVQAMESLHANPDQVAAMGAHSRTMAETRFNVHKVNAVMLQEMGITS
ncbi:glycosyl transferase [Pusillimonas sp. T7-7]|uniref:glycosyltransferase family 4 protein n=1 Tax=Pusillimonas sp. (strain T7-7) TaxID=1007105 RepID=UPI0002084D14|nr:glycosyltransferase family 4 protein [Pusillimonas sp. T7-7]AEC21752.1 glycosyl transferase [Pusillimonas sp. T7-7]